MEDKNKIEKVDEPYESQQNSEVECCEPVGEGFYLGTSCPKCKRPFRQNLK